MKIFVVNAGSSSLKYRLMDMESGEILASGLCEKIGEKSGIFTHKAKGEKLVQNTPMENHKHALELVLFGLTKGEYKVIDSIKEVSAFGHRIAQGAEKVVKSTIIDKEVLQTLEDISSLAPLHNPSQVLVIKECIALVGEEIPQIVVLDTAFHQTMEEKAYMYALPKEYYEKYAIRKYGFHGTSHKFVSEKLNSVQKYDKIITCHLGNGSSICAIKDGKSIDTSMGFTPLDGLLMGTRCGTIDPTILAFVAGKENLSFADVDAVMNKKSGLLGVSQHSNDFREIVSEGISGNKDCKLAFDMLCYQIQKYIGSYTVAMGGLDAIIFTGGIGENSVELREAVCGGLACLGVEFDAQKNKIRNGEVRKITAESSLVDVYIVPTDEEHAIALECEKLLA